MSKKRAGREDLESFETTYNAACSYIARGELAQGLLLLRKAKGTLCSIIIVQVVSYIWCLDLCSSSKDIPEAEKDEELLAIGVQELYVLSALDKAEQARTLGAEISTDKCVPSRGTTKLLLIKI